jgi:predicted metal-dependent hydrolase
MSVLTVGSTAIPYTLKRSPLARRARITVTPEEVEVVVPEDATDAQITRALHRRRAWILEQTRCMKERVAQTHTVQRFVTGVKIPYRGRLMKLTVTSGTDTLVEVTYRNGFWVTYPLTVSPNARDSLIESALRLWFRKRIREDVATFVQHHSGLGLIPKSVQIKDQKHLWGSCGRDRVVNLNWRLIFAPKPVLEYAVVHELCHIRHRNHDPEFWRLVGSIIHDWEERKLWLERNEHLLGFEKVEPAL